MTDIDEAPRRVKPDGGPKPAAAEDAAAAAARTADEGAARTADEAAETVVAGAPTSGEAVAPSDESVAASDATAATAVDDGAVDIETLLAPATHGLAEDAIDGPQSAADAGVTANPEATQELPQPYAPPAAIRLEELEAGGQTAIWPWAAPVEPAPLLAAPVTAIASPAELSSAAGARERRKRVQLRTSVTIILFLAGVAIGAVGLRVAAVQPAAVAPDGFPTLERTAGEPIQAGAVAHELAVNDVQGLAQLLDSDSLTALQTQLRPLVSFESVTFVGATTFDHDTFAGYVVRGRDSDGTLGLVGLVIRLRDGQVVAQ